jgi:hypothetical protein
MGSNKVNIGIVNCDDEEDLCTSFNIDAFPRLLYLHKNSYYKFTGERSIEKYGDFIY